MLAPSYKEVPRTRKTSHAKGKKTAPVLNRPREPVAKKREFFPNSDDVFYWRKPKITHTLIENIRPSLKLAYKLVAEANKSSHQNNERLYDRKAKPRAFEVKDLVYLTTPRRS